MPRLNLPIWRHNAYRQQIFRMMDDFLRPRGPFGHALDFGCGDGWFASRMKAEGLVDSIIPLDVTRRTNSFVTPTIFPGGRLPFDDSAFDLAYAVDVLHHCHDPIYFLQEIMRCTNRWLLIKDHTYTSSLGWLTLCLLDEVGNRRFGIPSRYKYQHHWEWIPIIEAQGFTRKGMIYPAPCHSSLLGACTNSLQFIGLWERGQDKCEIVSKDSIS
jgi:SAM-dependent methyltransferase